MLSQVQVVKPYGNTAVNCNCTNAAQAPHGCVATVKVNREPAHLWIEHISKAVIYVFNIPSRSSRGKNETLYQISLLEWESC